MALTGHPAAAEMSASELNAGVLHLSGNVAGVPQAVMRTLRNMWVHRSMRAWWKDYFSLSAGRWSRRRRCARERAMGARADPWPSNRLARIRTQLLVLIEQDTRIVKPVSGEALAASW